ncbi:MAG: DUF1330 domain-containing protein [Verrucomicrobia subdivision 3 bacterium]|nr:DUF1330 domain-containing protein [Verrucomicrobiales bacterium]MCI0745516.1 DUF1330 domain-containing protein [Limisphaerales bacterium]
MSLSPSTTAASTETQSVTVEIKPGKLYELAALWVKPEKREELQSYFQKAMPIAMKHGARPLAGFRLARASIGDFNPTQLGLAEWPSEEAFEEFLNDPEAKAIFPLRDGALEKMSVSHTTMIPPGSYTFSEGRIYEFAFLWVKEGKAEQLQKYFQVVKPLAHSKHGCSSVCGMQGLAPKSGSLDAHMVGITEWGSLQQFDGFIKDPEAASHFPERDGALAKLQVSHFTVSLPPKK